jgi:predicted transcriptional regulator
MLSSILMKICSMERILPELEKLQLVEYTNGSTIESKRTRRQKEMLDALKKVSWW